MYYRPRLKKWVQPSTWRVIGISDLLAPEDRAGKGQLKNFVYSGFKVFFFFIFWHRQAPGNFVEFGHFFDADWFSQKMMIALWSIYPTR